MDDRSDGLLHQRLDRLEEKGRATLAAAARAAAWRRAVDLAARSAIVVPVLVLIVAVLRPVPALPAMLFAVVVPLIVLVAAVAVRMARFGVERRAALAVIDRSLGLKDRSVIAAEFLADDRRDGFRRAALQEAMPWLERAGSTPMEMEADPARRDRYRWVLPLLGLAILVAALAIRPSPSPGPGTQEPSALRRIAMAMGLSPNRDEVDADRDRAGPQARSRDGTAAATGGGAAAGSSASGIGAAGVTKNGASAAGPAMPLGEARNGGEKKKK
ncbi:hypothetical protein ACQKJZ_07105, partial [Sphingomonas sp. NPDC019816]|uniref:hypothetical protein n=1 Tax=Sphingomonas sp. NPDC019816 TaxID=3390679 RepID=UPI003CFC4477